MALAVFDLDDTLIAGDSDTAWFDYMISSGLGGRELRSLNRQYAEDYARGTLDIEAYLGTVCGVLAEADLGFLRVLRATFIDDVIGPMMLPRSAALIDRHRMRGDKPIIVTSTLDFIVEPIAGLLGIADLIAPQAEIENDRFTGRTIGVPSFREGKVTRLEEWLEVTGSTAAGSHGYSDSHNDLPLLEFVDFPHAVDPDDSLRRHAIAAGWPIITLRDG